MVKNGARQSLRRTCFSWLVKEFMRCLLGWRIGCRAGQMKIWSKARRRPCAASDRATRALSQKFRTLLTTGRDVTK